MKKLFEISIHAIPRVFVLALIIIASLSVMEPIKKLIILLLSGMVSGIYHGLFTLSLWRKRDKDKHKKRDNIPYETNTLWTHIFCGLVASICFYLLINKPDIGTDFDLGSIFLLIMSLVGYTGLLPRTLWFFSYSGKVDK